MSTPRALPAYALIIAVNGHGLVAPENDAARLQRALIGLGVSAGSIEMLLGTNATRINIIQRLRGLAANKKIIYDAPILIYFAGHGAQLQVHVPTLGDRRSECIYPYDALNGRASPIPDITISALLGEIARSKSNHITLLLDCCHSGSGSRDSAVSDIANSNTGQLPEDLLNFNKDLFAKEDGELWSGLLKPTDPEKEEDNSRAVSTSPYSFRYQGVTSHVLIASCHEKEQSYEYVAQPGQPKRGLFTSALIEALGDAKEDRVIWSLTYTGLYSRIKEIMSDIGQGRFPQTPQCEGYHRSRYVFATPAFPHRNHAIAPIEELHQPGQIGLYVLPIGSLAGVHQKAMFKIYDYPGGRQRHIGLFPMVRSGDSQTIINAGRDLNLGSDAYAVLCTPPTALPVAISSDFIPSWNDPRFQTELSDSLGSHYPVTSYIAPVQVGQKHKLLISGSLGHGVRLETNTGSIINLRNASISLVVDALTKAVMFYHHLGQASISSNRPEPFELQVVELAETSGLRGLGPEDQNTVGALVPRPDRSAITLHSDRETQVIADQHASFGIRVRNRETTNYYIYAFYFDPSDLSITSIYMPPSSSGAPPPLRGRGELGIGYDSSGATQLQFTIDDHLDKDLGYFKVYFSTSPSELSTIQQEGVDPNQHGSSRPGGAAYTHATLPYGSYVYPIAVLNPRSTRH